MQIITIDDLEFTDLLHAWKDGKAVGKYWRNGKIQIVCATRQFMLVCNNENPEKIAIKPARSLSEAEDLAIQLLNRESERGSQVEIQAEYDR